MYIHIFMHITNTESSGIYTWRQKPRVWALENRTMSPTGPLMQLGYSNKKKWKNSAVPVTEKPQISGSIVSKMWTETKRCHIKSLLDFPVSPWNFLFSTLWFVGLVLVLHSEYADTDGYTWRILEGRAYAWPKTPIMIQKGSNLCFLNEFKLGQFNVSF